MILQSNSNTTPPCCDFSQKKPLLAFSSTSLRPPCSFYSSSDNNSCYHDHYRRRNIITPKKRIIKNVRWAILQVQACISGGNTQSHFKIDPNNLATRRGAKNIVLKRFSGDEFDYNSSNEATGNSSNKNGNYYSSSFAEDPIVDKLRTQLGVIHPIPTPPQINRNIVGLFAFFFFIGVVFDKLWTSRKRNTNITSKPGSWPQVPANLSMFLEKDLQRKESVEWVNMVLGKLWKVYRAGIENWIIGSLQPVIDDLKKPDYVQRVEIKQFSLGDEPLSVRSVERRTSRRINDLQ